MSHRASSVAGSGSSRLVPHPGGGYGPRTSDGYDFRSSNASIGEEAWVAVPQGVASLKQPRHQPRNLADIGSLEELDAATMQEGGAVQGGYAPSDSAFEEAVEEEDECTYLTDSYREWERHYLKRIAKRIHRLVCAELDSTEESLFMLFTRFDENLDGMVAGDEAADLCDAIEEAAPGTLSNRKGVGLCGRDGSISFISLLKWFEENGKSAASSSMAFSVSSMTVGLVGSGALQSDARLEGLSYEELRRNVRGYRRLLGQVRQLQEERALAAARREESAKGLGGAMQSYYDALARDFEGDAEHLFELFSEVDVSGNMMIEEDEVVELLKLLDPSASEDELCRYVAEINLSEGPLTFALLIDWWDQARSVPNSLVAEKGTALVAAVKARAAQRRLGGIFSEGSVQAQWRRAKDNNRLQALRQAYVRTLAEVRDYKLDRDLRTLEVECAQL